MVSRLWMKKFWRSSKLIPDPFMDNAIMNEMNTNLKRNIFKFFMGDFTKRVERRVHKVCYVFTLIKLCCGLSFRAGSVYIYRKWSANFFFSF